MYYQSQELGEIDFSEFEINSLSNNNQDVSIKFKNKPVRVNFLDLQEDAKLELIMKKIKEKASKIEHYFIQAFYYCFYDGNFEIYVATCTKLPNDFPFLYDINFYGIGKINKNLDIYNKQLDIYKKELEGKQVSDLITKLEGTQQMLNKVFDDYEFYYILNDIFKYKYNIKSDVNFFNTREKIREDIYTYIAYKFFPVKKKGDKLDNREKIKSELKKSETTVKNLDKSDKTIEQIYFSDYNKNLENDYDIWGKCYDIFKVRYILEHFDDVFDYIYINCNFQHIKRQVFHNIFTSIRDSYSPATLK